MNVISTQGRHPSTQHMARLFGVDHLIEPLRPIAMVYFNMAALLIDTISDGPELNVALRKLAESKDCAVRAVLFNIQDELEGSDRG